MPVTELHLLMYFWRYSHFKMAIFAKIAFFRIFKVLPLKSHSFKLHDNFFEDSSTYTIIPTYLCFTTSLRKNILVWAPISNIYTSKNCHLWVSSVFFLSAHWLQKFWKNSQKFVFSSLVTMNFSEILESMCVSEKYLKFSISWSGYVSITMTSTKNFNDFTEAHIYSKNSKKIHCHS